VFVSKVPPMANNIGNEREERSPTTTKLVADLHSARLAVDNVEWRNLLTRLAELRKGGE
jgi:hypothetical protein